MANKTIRVATDVGGTFSDLVAFETEEGNPVPRIITAKSDTTPPNFEEGVLNVLAKGGVDPASVDFLAHGTTVVINALTERKGVLVLLDALARIDPGISSRMSVTMAGRVEAALRERVEAGIRHLRKVRPELCLRLEDRWIPAAELDAIVAAGDVVLAPYQRFVGSSGVLLWAARMGIPVLTQDFGLLGRLVHDHRLGLTADTLDPASLAAGIERMVIEGPDNFVDPGAAQSFAASRTPRAFAAAVVTSLWRDEPRTLGAT